MMYLHLDAREGDRVFWFTTTGWMMWNFLVSVLLTDAAIVLYDGNPGTPDTDRLWDLAEEAGMTCFGTSASYIAACMKAGVEPAAGRDLVARCARSARRARRWRPRASPGSTSTSARDTWLFSTCGGTDLCTAFVGGCPVLPVYEGELQAPRARRRPARVRRGRRTRSSSEVGELVMTTPMPSMPLYFWGDEDGSRLREAYFEMYPGIWRHGDWIRITERGTAVIYGRSDSTINRGGIRMGTSEIYRAVLAVPDMRRRARRRRPAPGAGQLDAAVRRAARGRELDDALVAADPPARARGLLAAPRPERGPRDRRGAAHAVGQGARGAGQAHPHGRGARAAPRAATRSPTPPRSTSSSRWRSRRRVCPRGPRRSRLRRPRAPGRADPRRRGLRARADRALPGADRAAGPAGCARFRVVLAEEALADGRRRRRAPRRPARRRSTACRSRSRTTRTSPAR